AGLTGTGAYLQHGEKRLLITNEHVVRDWETQQFGHQFQGSDLVFRLGRPLALENGPVDAAVCAIENKVWNHSPHTAEAVPEARIAGKHETSSGELLFLRAVIRARARALPSRRCSRLQLGF